MLRLWNKLGPHQKAIITFLIGILCILFIGYFPGTTLIIFGLVFTGLIYMCIYVMFKYPYFKSGKNDR